MVGVAADAQARLPAGAHARRRAAGLYVQPIDGRGALRKPAEASLTVRGPTLTPDDVGEAEPGEYGKAEMYPEP